MADTGTHKPPADPQEIAKNLLRLAHMFVPHRDDALMRDICRLAVKCVQEGLARG